MAKANIPALKAELKRHLAAATVVQEKLLAARDAGDERIFQQFWSWHEVKELLDEKQANWLALMPYIAGQASTQSAFAALAKLAVSNARTQEKARRGETIIDLLKPKKGK
jgi:hypothetical protein